MKTEILALPSGAQFFRADLHIHSVAGSHDVKDKSCTPEAIVAMAAKEELRMIAIADHNEISGVATAIAAGEKAGVFVVPAVELSTAQGHLLCYLPTLEVLQRFYARLTIVDRGKDSSHCQQGMVECLNLVREHKGFCLLAHIDGGAGFESMVPTSTPHKKGVINHEALVGIELKSASSKISYSDLDPDAARRALGAERATKMSSRQSLARVLNSDSHTLGALGRNAAGDTKVSRFKMTGLKFESLHIALLDADARVRLEDEVPATVPFIEGVRMSGGFLKDQSIHFSPNLNCIIGGRGTGKSLTFEGLRLLSGNPGLPFDVVDSEVWPDQIDLIVRDQAGEVHVVSRGHGGTRENGDDPFADPVGFPIECYRQGETHAISQAAKDDPAALLSYLDRFVDVRADLDAEVQLRNQLLDQQSKIEKANDHIDRIPKVEAELNRVKAQIAAIEKQKGKEIIALQRTVAREKSIREAIKAHLDAIDATAAREDLRERVSEIKGAADPKDLKLGTQEFTAIAALATAFEAELNKSDLSLKAHATTLSDGVIAALKAWQVKAQASAQDLEAKKKALEGQGVIVDVAFFQKLANDEDSLTKELARLNTWKPYRTTLVAERNKALAERWATRERIATKRAAFADQASKALKSSLTELVVSLKFDRSAYSTEANDIIIAAMGWRTVQVPRASHLTEDLTVKGLLDAIAKKNVAAVTALRSEGKSVFNNAEAAAILDRLGDPQNRYRLERCHVVDRPRLTVTRSVVGLDGTQQTKSRQFSHLSLGQQQSVLLALMLSADSNVPLLIDQPEDNLDSEFIYNSIVPVLRSAKERRQIIVVTHNANIAVLGDAEQVIVLKSTAEQAVIAARGSIDDPATRDVACTVLEGARDAFKRRARMYGYALTETKI